MEVKIKNKKIVVITLLLITFISITFAYVISQISDGAVGDANVTADTTDNLSFNINKDINLNPTQFNVPEGGGGLSDTAVGTTTLLANSSNNTATFTYYVYFNIKSNNYTYTTEEQNPELVLTITDPTGAPVTSVEGLTYVTVQNADGSEVKGFDITTQSGLFNIASLYEITSNSSIDATVQDWLFTVTFINLTTNQAENGGSTLNAEILLSKEKKVLLTNYLIENVYVDDGVNDFYYHDGLGDYENSELEAGDGSYRYSGTNPNNYICFDNEVEKCSAENLYRIIGIFDNQLKLIKNTSIGKMAWNNSANSDWSESSLNNYLNTEYLNTLNNITILDKKWYLGTNSNSNGNTKEFYDSERSENVYGTNSTTFDGKIGLIYISDYGYAASPDCWNQSIISYNNVASGKNWLILGSYQWSIGHSLGKAGSVYAISGSGRLDNAQATNSYDIRPVFYLSETILFDGGTGTATDPYIVK